AGRRAFRTAPSQRVAQFKPAPGIRRPRIGLLPSFVHPVVSTNVPLSVGSVTRRCDDRTPRGHRERHARQEWSAKARNHSRVALLASPKTSLADHTARAYALIVVCVLG